MKKKIKIIAGTIAAEAELLSTSTAEALWDALPLESACNIWGDEIYFTIPLSHGLEKDARETVAIGDLGFWPQGPAFCIFFGPTPISTGNEIKPASAVNIVGKVVGDTEVFKSVQDCTNIKLERM